MDKDTTMTAPVNALEETAQADETLEVQTPTMEERMTSVEQGLQDINTRFDGVIEEQDKIVDILEQISAKVNEDEPTAATETVAVGEAANSVDEVETNEVDTPRDEETVVEPATTEVEPTEEAPEQTPAVEEEIKEEVNNKMSDEQFNALVTQIKNEIADATVQAPAVVETEEVKTEERDPEIATNYLQRYNDQVAAAWDYYRLHNNAAGEKLRKINAYNARVKNDADANVPMTIESLGNFVLPPEIDNMIHGSRTNYSALLDALEYTQTSALQFAYATRVGDIHMRNVKFCDDGEDGNLKPIETYELTRGVAQMEELAAVTPICDNATKYLAADILADVAAGYRNDYDRNLAELAIARFQEAIDTTGNAVEYNPLTSIDSLVDFIKSTTLVSDAVVNGTFVFNSRTKAAILEHMLRSGNDGLGVAAFTQGETPTIWGYPYIVVPNDLMPTLGSDEVRSFKVLDNATGSIKTVDVTSPVFYGDLNSYRGKVNGGLNYTVSTDAMYEVGNGGSKEYRSAFQRNEMVLRGSMFRGGYLADQTVIAGLVPTSN